MVAASHNSGRPEDKEIQIKFRGKAVEIINELRKRTDKDAAQVISDALGLYDWAFDQEDRGLKIASTKQGRAVDELDLSTSG